MIELHICSASWDSQESPGNSLAQSTSILVRNRTDCFQVRTSNDPEINVQSSSIQVDGHDVSFVKLEVLVRVRRLDGVASGSIAEHAIASHLDVEDVLLSISIAVRKYPFGTLAATGQAMHGIAILSPDEAFVISVPVELEMVLVTEFGGHGQVDAEPMGRPAGTKRLADAGGAEVVPRGFLEGRTSEVGRGVDVQLDMIAAGSAGVGDFAGDASTRPSQRSSGRSSAKYLRQKSLGLVLAARSELTQAIQVDLVDLLAHGASRELGVFLLRCHPEVCFAAHGGEERSDGWSFWGSRGQELEGSCSSLHVLAALRRGSSGAWVREPRSTTPGRPCQARQLPSASLWPCFAQPRARHATLHLGARVASHAEHAFSVVIDCCLTLQS